MFLGLTSFSYFDINSSLQIRNLQYLPPALFQKPWFWETKNCWIGWPKQVRLMVKFVLIDMTIQLKSNVNCCRYTDRKQISLYYFFVFRFVLHEQCYSFMHSLNKVKFIHVFHEQGYSYIYFLNKVWFIFVFLEQG